MKGSDIMPGWKPHIIVGAAVPAALAFYTGFGADWTLSMGIAASAVGSLIPDIDAEYSKIRQICKPVAKFYDKFPKDNPFFEHRGLCMHSALTLVPFIIFYLRFNHWITLGLFFGVLSHHMLDALSPQGLPNYFWKKWRMRDE